MSSSLFAVQSLGRVWLYDPMDCSTPGFVVLRCLLEFAQTHVHWVHDAINHLILCHPFPLLPSIFPSIRGLLVVDRFLSPLFASFSKISPSLFFSPDRFCPNFRNVPAFISLVEAVGRIIKRLDCHVVKRTGNPDVWVKESGKGRTWFLLVSGQILTWGTVKYRQPCCFHSLLKRGKWG